MFNFFKPKKSQASTIKDSLQGRSYPSLTERRDDPEFKRKLNWELEQFKDKEPSTLEATLMGLVVGQAEMPQFFGALEEAKVILLTRKEHPLVIEHGDGNIYLTAFTNVDKAAFAVEHCETHKDAGIIPVVDILDQFFRQPKFPNLGFWINPYDDVLTFRFNPEQARWFCQKSLSRLAKKEEKIVPPSLPQDTQTVDETEKPILVFDAYGREMRVSRDEWRDKILPGHLQKHWDSEEDLAATITQAFHDGFFEEMIGPAERLRQIDPNAERSAVLLAIAYLKRERLDDSERVLLEYQDKHGSSGSVLTNLAKVYAARGQEELVLATLWRALEADPNLDNGLGWYEVIHREKGGDEASLEALRRVAALPGSWRACLWLARAALEHRQLEEALLLYREALKQAGNPSPVDLLRQLSGDLGIHGHLPELLALTEPRYRAEVHGLPVGNNLIKANLDLGRLDAARALLEDLYAQKRPDWNQQLAIWDTEIAKAGIAAASPLKAEDFKVAMLKIDGPVWLKPDSPAAELFPVKLGQPVHIAFLGGSAEAPTNSQKIEQQLSDARGRLSRAIPLFLAEQLEFHTDAHAQTLVPWITREPGGFVLAGAPWSDEQAAASARQGEVKNDYAVCIHLLTGQEPWLARVRLIRTIDGACLGSVEESFHFQDPVEGIQKLAREILNLAAREFGVESREAPSLYAIPEGEAFPYYLLRLEQLLAVRCAAMGVSRDGESFLNGEREILDGNLQQCLAYPESVSLRLLLAQTFQAMKIARPAVSQEFKERIELLQRKQPLSEPAQAVVQRILAI